eukprot:scaffold11204_cov139-Skeletonema_dohrnii-CCMP3373.AAC.3
MGDESGLAQCCTSILFITTKLHKRNGASENNNSITSILFTWRIQAKETQGQGVAQVEFSRDTRLLCASMEMSAIA